jgi:glycosyltransferase involved in cell wall biosynthesis
MVGSSPTHPTDLISQIQPPIGSSCRRLGGKRAAMVTFSVYPGDPRPRRAVDALVGEGMQVDLICLAGENALRHEKLNGIEILRVPLKNRRGGKLAYACQYAAFILISSLIFALRSLTCRYDLVYVHNMPDILVVSSLIPRALGAKVILDLHDPMPELMMTIFNVERDRLIVRLISRIEKWSMARANLVLTVNVACKRIFGSRSCRPEKIGVIMNSPDSEIFPFRTPESYAPTNEAGDKRFVIMYHGSLVKRNGLDLAVDAFARVRKSVPTAELRVYGARTVFFDRVMEAARNKGVDEAIRYLGPKRLEELVPAIQECDVGVIPNPRNAFTEINTPTRIFEYLTLGKPVIAPNTPGIQDYFNNESLLFFESGNSEDLAEKIEYVFSHGKEANEMVGRGQQVYLTHKWSNERQRLVGLVSNLLNAEKDAMQLCSR